MLNLVKENGSYRIKLRTKLQNGLQKSNFFLEVWVHINLRYSIICKNMML
jgi:hypothetical protein